MIFFHLIFAFSVYFSFLENSLATKGPDPEAFITSGGNQIDDFIRQSETLVYSYDPEAWDDIRPLVINPWSGEDITLCVTGVYGIYEFEHYKAEGERGVNLFGGINKCILQTNIGSVQLITTFRDIFWPTLSVFRSDYFREAVFPIPKALKNFKESFGESVESLVINGPQPWSVVSVMNVSYCIQPVYDNETILFPICSLSSMKDTAFGNDTIWKSVKPHCDGKIDKTVEVNSCFALLNVVNKEIQIALKRTNEQQKKAEVFVEEDAAPEEDLFILECNEDLKEFLLLLDLRLNNDYSSMYQMRFPVDKSHAWKTEILDLVFDIGIDSCWINKEANPSTTPFMREVFIYFIEKTIWAKGGGWPITPNDTLNGTYYQMYNELWECHERRKIIDEHDAMVTYEASEPIIPEFQRIPTYDLMMESLWLLANQVTSVCHITSRGATNFWLDFYPLFKKMYLTPMVEHWKNPGMISKYWHILMTASMYTPSQFYDGSAQCASYWKVYSRLDLYKRPKDLESGGASKKHK